GSLGVDVATAVDIHLRDNNVQKIKLQVKGSLSSQKHVHAVLMGHSSLGASGVVLIPGVIDADCEGDIYALLFTLTPPIVIPAGTCIAQLIAVPAGAPLTMGPERTGGFSSTGKLVCLTTQLGGRPLVTVILQQGSSSITVTALLDTGADVSIVS
ncbi:POK9 protein, partial [Eudromia elegans]|nr:POK9 protein [Eudromia elegans]